MLAIWGVAMTLASCAVPGSTESEGVVDSAKYVELYQETVADFPEKMPDGVGFPEEPPAMSGDIGIGNAAGAAYFQWNCAWTDVYLTDDDPDVRAEAMEQLERFPHTEWGMNYLEDPDGIWDGWLQAAVLGDLTPLRETYETGCDYYRETEDEWSTE